jgi:hypothetical protein
MSAADKAAIEWELMRLCVDFAHYLDTSAYEALANLFLPEGVWDRMTRQHAIDGPWKRSTNRASSGVSPAEASKK